MEDFFLYTLSKLLIKSYLLMFFKNAYFIFIISSIFIFSCYQQKKEPESIKKEENILVKKPEVKLVKKVVEKNPVKKDIRVTNKNVRSFLTKYASENHETLVLITTDLGEMKVRLYKKTLLHRANFIRLVKSGFYDNTLFYRVVGGFVIQGGDSDDEERLKKKEKAGSYEIPAEFDSRYFHKKGAIAMTRDYKDNPAKKSAPFDFYIVQGEIYSQLQLDAMEKEYNIKIDQTKREVYTTLGGAPHLDGEHTVFGEVIEGFETINKISSVETDRSDWPVKDVFIRKIEILK